jgi:hypothetical protein
MLIVHPELSVPYPKSDISKRIDDKQTGKPGKQTQHQEYTGNKLSSFADIGQYCR